MRERSGRQDVPQRSGPNGLARLASAVNATNGSGGEAEPKDGEWIGAAWAAARGLRSVSGVAHSAARRTVEERKAGAMISRRNRSYRSGV